MAEFRIGGGAINQTPLDWKGNFERIVEALDKARNSGTQVLCLPELCITGYGCEDLFLAPWFVEKAKEQLIKLLPFTNGLYVTLGLPMTWEGNTYNVACYVHDTRVLGFSAKQFLANDGVHYEKRWFSAWPSGKQSMMEFEGTKVPFGEVIYETLGLKTGLEICEDAWVGENRPAYRYAKRGVKLILNPSASHFAFGKTKLREKLVLEGSSIIQGIYCYANLLGNETGKMIFDGEIMIAQNGNLIQLNDRLSFHDVALANCFCNTEDPKKTEKKDLALYANDKETEFHEAVTLGLYDYMRKSRSRGFVLSLSGGADSSALAIMVATMVERGCKEIGAIPFAKKAGCFSEEEISKLDTFQSQKEINNYLVSKLLTTAYQGTINSSDKTFESAKELAESIGAIFYHWEIDEEVNSYTSKVETALGRKLTWEQDDITKQNIQARSRAPIIWMFANINKSLLLATSNRSEASVGYATMDGDTAGSISPIAGVDKHFILSYLKYAEEKLGYTGLRFVNSLQPSAELRPLSTTQTDEKDLMPYPILEKIERLAIKERLSPKSVYLELKDVLPIEKNTLKLYIKKFFTLWSRNQWKRERYAPSFHLDDFSVDPRSWCRFPILSGGFVEELAELENLT